MQVPVSAISDRETVIYSLACSCDPLRVRYAGKTIQPLDQYMKTCLAEAKNNPTRPVEHWRKKHHDLGHEIISSILEIVPAGENWAAVEIAAIAAIPEGDRLNIALGGDGGKPSSVYFLKDGRPAITNLTDGISTTTFFSRVLVYGWDVDRAASEPLKFSPSFRGTDFKLADGSLAIDNLHETVTKERFVDRIRKNWTVNEARLTPAGARRDRTPKKRAEAHKIKLRCKQFTAMSSLAVQAEVEADEYYNSLIFLSDGRLALDNLAEGVSEKLFKGRLTSGWSADDAAFTAKDLARPCKTNFRHRLPSGEIARHNLAESVTPQRFENRLSKKWSALEAATVPVGMTRKQFREL